MYIYGLCVNSCVCRACVLSKNLRLPVYRNLKLFFIDETKYVSLICVQSSHDIKYKYCDLHCKRWARGHRI